MSFPDTQQMVDAFQGASEALLRRVSQYDTLARNQEQHMTELQAAMAGIPQQLAALEDRVRLLTEERDRAVAERDQALAKVAKFDPQIQAEETAKLKAERDRLDRQIAEREKPKPPDGDSAARPVK